MRPSLAAATARIPIFGNSAAPSIFPSLRCSRPELVPIHKTIRRFDDALCIRNSLCDKKRFKAAIAIACNSIGSDDPELSVSILKR